MTTEEIIQNATFVGSGNILTCKRNKYIKKSEWDEHIFSRREEYLQNELDESIQIESIEKIENELNETFELNPYKDKGFQNLVFNNLDTADELVNFHPIMNSSINTYTFQLAKIADFTKKIYLKIYSFNEKDIPILMKSSISVKIGGEEIFNFPFPIILCINYLTNNKIEYDIEFIRIPVALFDMYFSYGIPNISLQYHDVEITFINYLENYNMDFEILATHASSEIRIRFVQISLENTILEYKRIPFYNKKEYNYHDGKFILFDMLYFPNCDSELIEFRISANNGEDYIIYDDFIKIHFYNYTFYIIPFCPELKNSKILKDLYKNKFNLQYLNFSSFDPTYNVIHLNTFAEFELYTIGINRLNIMSGMCGKSYAS
jgi:hypothetical protein